MGDRTLHRYGLRTGCLLVQLDATETGQQIGDLAMDDMAAIELGGDLHAKPQLTPPLFHGSRVGHGSQEIAAELMKARDCPFMIASQVSTVERPVHRGGSKP
jgi:hypothetical protein